MIVVDASVLLVALTDDRPNGDEARSRLSGERWAAPEVIDLEVLSVLRRRRAAGVLEERRARLAIADLVESPLVRASHVPLIGRCWELRDNVTSYDAAYIALAEALRAPLITADARLASAPGLQCTVEVLPARGKPGQESPEIVDPG